MKPDRNNYEIWIIDYLEGKLSAVQEKLLMEFLDNNPDIREEFDNLHLPVLVPGDEVFENKESLARSLSDITDEQFDLLSIGHLENDLSASQEEELYRIIEEDPEKRDRFEFINRLRLQPPVSGYRYKNRLKRLTAGGKVIRLSAAVIGAAAAVALFLVWFYPARESIPEMIAVNPGESDMNTLLIISSPAVIKEPAKESGKAVPQALKYSDKKENQDQMASNKEDIFISYISLKENIPLRPDISLSLAALKPTELTAAAAEYDVESRGIRSAFTKLVREKILKSEPVNGDEIKPYEIAGAGINGLNSLLGWQMALNQKVDESGEVVAVSFNSKLLKFNLPVKKTE